MTKKEKYKLIEKEIQERKDIEEYERFIKQYENNREYWEYDDVKKRFTCYYDYVLTRIRFKEDKKVFKIKFNFKFNEKILIDEHKTKFCVVGINEHHFIFGLSIKETGVHNYRDFYFFVNEKSEVIYKFTEEEYKIFKETVRCYSLLQDIDYYKKGYNRYYELNDKKDKQLSEKNQKIVDLEDEISNLKDELKNYNPKNYNKIKEDFERRLEVERGARKLVEKREEKALTEQQERYETLLLEEEEKINSLKEKLREYELTEIRLAKIFSGKILEETKNE